MTKKNKSIIQKSIDSFEKARLKKKKEEEEKQETPVRKWGKKYQKSMKEENLSKKETPLEYKLRNVPDYIYESIDELKEKPAKRDPRRDPFRGKYSNLVRKPKRLKA